MSIIAFNEDYNCCKINPTVVQSQKRDMRGSRIKMNLMKNDHRDFQKLSKVLNNKITPVKVVDRNDFVEN